MGVKVLGTSFNVSAYREDVEKSVVLVTGKVEVTASNGESVRILPNDRFRQSTDKYVVDKVNVEDYVSWKEGRLSFKNTELGGILKQLSRYYNVRIDYDKQQFIIKTLEQCSTGKDRIAAPLLDKDGITIAHKTGSGYTNENGVLAAHNDVAYIRLPNGICYTLAVFVKDFKGNETQAAKAIAHISAIVYSLVTQTIEHS